jgi:membrane protein involved in colicin uptake
VKAAQTTRPAAQTTARRRKPVRATTYDARRAAMARAVDQMFEDRDLTTREDF